MDHPSHDHGDPLRPHRHDPNPHPPGPDPTIQLSCPGDPQGQPRRITLADLRALPPVSVPDCLIVSTGHGTSGPFTFTGPRLLDLIQAHCPGPWSQVAVISGDGFGTRVLAAELTDPRVTRPIILAYAVDGQPLSREQGLVRLIVPSETDDALRQVKWVAQVQVR